jgi:protein-glutamine gamma-glutamyltransferase
MRRMLQLPPGFNPRTLELGQQLRARYQNNAAIMNAALTLLREQKFVYTLEPPLLGRHAVDEFLFETRSGFCEHFSSSFVVLMRAAGVPARVVTGYLGGEYNTLGNYLIVRQSDAHGWTEVWLENRGWVRVDPTNAVSPARADSGLAAAMPAGMALPGALRNSHALLRELAMTLDSLANSWNQTVLGFNLETQRALLFRAGLDAATWLTLATFLIVATGVVTLLLVLFTLCNRRHNSDPALAAYRAFCAKTARAGLARQPDEGPIDYAARLAAARPDAAEAVRTITQAYVAIRYNKSFNIKYLLELQQNVRQFAL